ncbi:ATP-binding protein [Sphingomonas aerolata]|uniref:ATP-binding protein n=1 Tax=Sphingomonas aerolata TaxID=185951 RepID=UPI002FE3C247
MTSQTTAPHSDLADEIRATADSGTAVETTLATNQRIISRVTDGIYREPWAAFRELIANAYDADAARVTVESGAPHFDKVTVRDDGSGMSPDTLAYMLRNIGGSSKRTKAGAELQTSNSSNLDLSPQGRPLIGKIGIGLFAVAQLTQHFQIITKARGDKIRSSATVLLRTYNEQELRETDPDVEYVAGTVKILSETVGDDQLQAHGTSIVLYSLRPEIRKSLQSLRLWDASMAEGIDGATITEKPKFHIGVLPETLSSHPSGTGAKLPWSPDDSPVERFRKLVEAAGDDKDRGSKPLNLEHFDEYLRAIWKLSLSLPLRYLNGHPFDKAADCGITFLDIPKGKAAAAEIDLPEGKSVRAALGLTTGLTDGLTPFSVTFDGVELLRPITLPNTLRKPSRVKAPLMMVAREIAPFKPEVLQRAGGRLSFEAYLYWNSKIIPKDTSGVLIRVREASGTLFDTSFLGYQVSEQNRLSQITAEIFVQEGLDGAINIDRESFNYSHPHYLYIQRWLHKALRLLINKQKLVAKDDLESEKKEGIKAVASARASKALSVWTRRFGDDADLPDQPSLSIPLTEVGSSHIDWPVGQPKSTTDIAGSLAIILEAYGALASLSSRERSRMINDIISLFDVKV